MSIIFDPHPLKEKIGLVGNGQIWMYGHFCKSELLQCAEMVKDPELDFIATVERQSDLKVRVRDMESKRYFQFYIEKDEKSWMDNTTISEIPTLEQAKAFFKGYLAYSKVQSKVNPKV